MNHHQISIILASFEFNQKVEVMGNHIYKVNPDIKEIQDGSYELGSRYYFSDPNTIFNLFNKLGVKKHTTTYLNNNIKVELEILHNNKSIIVSGFGVDLAEALARTTAKAIDILS